MGNYGHTRISSHAHSHLYFRSAGKRAGNHFSTLNREILGRGGSRPEPSTSPAWGARPAAELNKLKARKGRAEHLPVPRVGGSGGGGSSYRAPPPAALFATTGRRTQDDIRAELRSIEEGIRRDAARPAQGPLLDDLEKERLAVQMCFRSQVPQEVEEAFERRRSGKTSPSKDGSSPFSQSASTRLRPPPGRSKRDENTIEEAERLFKQVLGEVEEREAFLEKMTALGRRRLYEQVIKLEIGSRLGHLKRLDAIIEGERRTKHSTTTTSSPSASTAAAPAVSGE